MSIVCQPSDAGTRRSLSLGLARAKEGETRRFNYALRGECGFVEGCPMAVSKVSLVEDMTTCLMQVPKWNTAEKHEMLNQ